MIGVILKVFLVSIGLAIAIKYGAPFLSVPVTATAALVGVLSPPLILGLILGWRWQRLRMP